MITVRTKQDVIFSSGSSLPEHRIKEETFEYHESSRSVIFVTRLDETKMQIPFENIIYIAYSNNGGNGNNGEELEYE